ncbi:MAG: alanine racemase [Rhodoglobus sp.]
MREALVDLGAIARNVETLCAAAGDLPAMVIVKANGYGHGAVESARAAVEGGATWLGVADIDEALELRAAGVDTPVLAWLHDPEQDFSDAIAAGVDLGVSSLGELDRAAAASGRAQVQVKVDTGLGRNGAEPGEWHELFAAAAAHERAGRLRVRGLWSHLANAGEAADAAQIALFETALTAAHAAGLTPDITHLAATAGALRVPRARFGFVRLGVGAYGLSPFDDEDAAALKLTPAMELRGTIVSTKRVATGAGVSYGHDYHAPRETTLALVPLGYADGIPRQASGKASVSIEGVIFPVVGRIAMDQFVVDVGDTPVFPGDVAIVFGDPATGAPSATDWADAAGTINYDLVTGIGRRIRRRYR